MFSVVNFAFVCLFLSHNSGLSLQIKFPSSEYLNRKAKAKREVSYQNGDKKPERFRWAWFGGDVMQGQRVSGV